jgi:hypothetical protein
MMPAMVPTRYFDPLRHRDFALFWSGRAVSQLGDGVFTVTLALEALRVDRHATGLSYVLAARLVPAVLFTLLGGVIVDRFPRRFALLASSRSARWAWSRPARSLRWSACARRWPPAAPDGADHDDPVPAGTKGSDA